MSKKDRFGAFKNISSTNDGTDVCVQRRALVAIVNQQNVIIGQQAAVTKNLRSERRWLEEDNQIQREELEKSQKNLNDLETSRKLSGGIRTLLGN